MYNNKGKRSEIAGFEALGGAEATKTFDDLAHEPGSLRRRDDRLSFVCAC
jgi:hypothetical protein